MTENDDISDEEFIRFIASRELSSRTPPKFVLFVDMLGFSALTEQHPDDIDFDLKSEEWAKPSPTAETVSRFLDVFDTVPKTLLDGIAPSHLMLFSDCAFVVYENPLQAALSAVKLMQLFLRSEVPVRMGLAYGSWHTKRLSLHSQDDILITHAAFFGSAVVRAHLTESGAGKGKGCRIFLHHASITSENRELITHRVPILKTPEQHPAAQHELNFLYHEPLDEMGHDQDLRRLFAPLYKMFSALPQPVTPEVAAHYTDSFDAFNRMRTQLSRPTVARAH